MKFWFKDIAILLLSAAIFCLPAASDAENLNPDIQNILKGFEQQIKSAGEDRTDFIVVRSFFDEVDNKTSRRSEEISDKVYQVISDKYLGKTKVVILNWKSEKPLGKHIASKSDEIVYKQGALEKQLNENFGKGFLITGTITFAGESDVVNAELIDMKSGRVLISSKTAIPFGANEAVLAKETVPFGQTGVEAVKPVLQKALSKQMDAKKVVPASKTTPSEQTDAQKTAIVKKPQTSQQVAAVNTVTAVETAPAEIKVTPETTEKDLVYKVIQGVNFKYEGHVKDGQKHGQGTLTFKSGDTYIGQWRNDKKHGQGTYIFAAGDKYDGQWKDNKMDGQGTYFFTSGNKYIGEWRNDKKHGQGTYYYKNGDKWEGTYVNNKKHGYGIYTWAGGQSTKEFWQDGKLVE